MNCKTCNNLQTWISNENNLLLNRLHAFFFISVAVKVLFVQLNETSSKPLKSFMRILFIISQNNNGMQYKQRTICFFNFSLELVGPSDGLFLSFNYLRYQVSDNFCSKCSRCAEKFALYTWNCLFWFDFVNFCSTRLANIKFW